MGIFSSDDADFCPPTPRCFVCGLLGDEQNPIIYEYGQSAHKRCGDVASMIYTRAFDAGKKAGRVEAGATPRASYRDWVDAVRAEAFAEWSISMVETLRHDAALYGVAVVKRNADGSYERVDPTTVQAVNE